MTQAQRIFDEPAWLLHHRPFRDASRILDILSRDHGRLSLVARGSRSTRSRLKGILRPFMPLRLSWTIRTDLGTLTGAEIGGAPISLAGDALLSAYYINELMLHFLHRHDAQPEVFDAYGAAIRALHSAPDVAPVLRGFEMDFLRLLGYAINLVREAGTGEELQADRRYEYRVEQGVVEAANANAEAGFTGAELQAIHRQEFGDPATLQSAGRLMRQVVAWHLGGKELKSRRVLREIRRGATSGD